MKVVVADIEMNTGVPDADGTLWYITEWDGWDSPAVRQATLDPVNRHGTTITEGLFGARSLSLTGIAKATSEANFWKSYNRLLGTTARLKSNPFGVVVSEDVDKVLWCVRSSNVKNDLKGGSAFEFNIPLLAEDPLKYGTVLHEVTIAAGDNETIVNAGTGPSYPLVVAGADMEMDVEAVATGLRLRSGFVPSGTVFDMNRRTAYSGTTSVYGAIKPTSNWWALDPGSNEITNHGTESITVQYYDSWV